MKIDALFASCGFTGSTGPDVEEALLEGAVEFLKAGGFLTFTEWTALTRESKEAFLNAGDHLRRELAALIGSASQGGLAPLVVSGEMSPEDAQVRKALLEVRP